MSTIIEIKRVQKNKTIMKIVKQVGNWILLSKSVGGRIVYWIDNGNDDVSEYIDEFDCIDLIECKEFEFVNKCLGFFN